MKNRSNIIPKMAASVDIAELRMARGELLALCRDAVSVVETSRIKSRASLVDGKSCPPESLFVLLTYCYALSIYGSRQIEEKVRTDEALQNVANECQPDYAILQEFRRTHRAVIQQCLKRVYWFVWVKYRAQHPAFVLTVDDQRRQPVRVGPTFSSDIHLESDACLSRAAFEDRMMAD